MRLGEIAVLSLLLGTAPVVAGAVDAGTDLRIAAQALRASNVDGAIWYASEAIRIDPAFARAYGIRSIAFQAKGQYGRAIDDATKAIIFDPNDAVAFNNRGAAYAASGQHANAIADYNKAIALRPDLAEAYMGRGVELGRIGSFDNSVADLEKAVALRPNYAEAHQNLGVSLDHLGRRDQAQAEYRTALALRPDLQPAQNAAARPTQVVFSNVGAAAPMPATTVVGAPPAGEPPLPASAAVPLSPVSVAPLQRPPAAMASVAVPPPQSAVPPPPRFPDRPLAVSFPRGPDRPNDIAVIIGNANYGKFGKDIPDVRPAYADAEGIRLYVKQALGIHDENILFVKDATGAQMVTLFGNDREFKGKLYNYVQPAVSRVFVYYAGHGAPPAERDGSPYLVPADADAASLELSGYPLRTLYSNLGKLPAEHVTLVLEACFSGLSPDGSVIPKASPIRLVATAPVVPRNLTVISAGKVDQMASWERDDSDGLFTKYFLLGMSGEAARKPYGNGDGKVTLDGLGRYLKDTVTYYARRYYGRDQTVQFIKGAGA
jgi:tetratricopeptide (TPR) repeat protein